MNVNLKTINRDSGQFPLFLKEIQNPPKKIFVSGELPADPPEGGIKIAVVGTRKATSSGKIFAKKLAKELAENGVIIVSGLALGIDTAAHEGALEARGKTLVVLANGLDKIYPAQNENLAKAIVNSGGALISEYPTGTPSYPNQFLERNRIISGLCLAAVIIEAPDRSGSLATARFAVEQGREVFVVPGPAGHPNFEGSHKLIRDGARLISSVQDILEDLGLESKKQKDSKNKIFDFKNIKDENQLRILKIIAFAGNPVGIDKIIEISKLEPQTVNQSLALLTITKVIKETEKGYEI